jgi:hypothetical protein
MIPHTVFMAAFETTVVIAQENGARDQGGGTLGGAVLETALHHRGDADAIMHLLERPVTRARRADDIANAPPAP